MIRGKRSARQCRQMNGLQSDIDGLKSIDNEQDYEWAVREVTGYFDAEPAPGTPDGNRFEVLLALIKGYEDKHFALPHCVTT